jgi:3-keto-5-aminohexanoate cleavage enzyme
MDLIVNFTPTGMIPTKSMTPHIPVSCDEIINQVNEASNIGITMVHLHVREEQTGEPTYKPELYQRIIGGIREFNPELVICVSLSGRTFKEFEQRSAALGLEGDSKPDMGSLTLGSINFNKETSVNCPSMIQELARTMKERNILPELEVFDLGMVNYAKYLINKGLLEAPHYFNFILGNVSCAQADILHLAVLLRDLPQDSLWSVGGIGNFQLMINSVAIAIGGGVRVGLEDNIWFDSARTRLARNSDLLKRIKTLARANERNIMSPAELRKRLKLEDGHGRYGGLSR